MGKLDSMTVENPIAKAYFEEAKGQMKVAAEKQIEELTKVTSTASS